MGYAYLQCCCRTTRTGEIHSLNLTRTMELKLIRLRLLLSGDVELNPGPAIAHQLLGKLNVKTVTPPDTTSPLYTGKKPALDELQCFTYTSDSGTMENIYIINGVAARWQNLGIALKFSDDELRAIERSKFFQVEDCCREVLSRWLKGRAGDGKPITWETLLQAMVKAQCTEVARRARKALTGEGVVDDSVLPNQALYRIPL